MLNRHNSWWLSVTIRPYGGMENLYIVLCWCWWSLSCAHEFASEHSDLHHPSYYSLIQFKHKLTSSWYRSLTRRGWGKLRNLTLLFSDGIVIDQFNPIIAFILLVSSRTWSSFFWSYFGGKLIFWNIRENLDQSGAAQCEKKVISLKWQIGSRKWWENEKGCCSERDNIVWYWQRAKEVKTVWLERFQLKERAAQHRTNSFVDCFDRTHEMLFFCLFFWRRRLTSYFNPVKRSHVSTLST